MGLPLCVICFYSLIVFNILSLFSVLVVLMIVSYGVVLVWSGLFVVLEASVPIWALFSLDLGNFLLLFY
jgi:hypothetical protein